MCLMSRREFNPDYPHPKAGEPPLHRAAREGDHAAIQSLAEGGADLNEVFDIGLDPSGRPSPATPLMVAAGSGEGATVETVALLLERGADPRRTVNGQSAATFACRGLGWNYPAGGDADRLRLLLEKGSPLSDDSTVMQRLLADTAGEGDADLLQVLLAHGLSPNAVWDPEGARQEQTALRGSLHDLDRDEEFFAGIPEEFRAQMEESMRTFEDEMEEQSASAPYSFQIPLFQAVESGSEACVRLLLDAGADISVRDNSQRTAMYYAGNDAVIKLLQGAGLPVEDSDTYGWSPLIDAVSDGEEALPRIRGLIAAGADVRGTHDRGYTVFMSAVGSGRDPAVLRLLIESGANPHAVTELGYNAFHAAIDVNGEANAEESVRDTLGYLRELGVDIEHRNGAGQTPLARAIESGTAVEVQVLCELGADVEAVVPLRVCGAETCEDNELPLLFHTVLGSGVDADEKAESLLKAGANPQVTNVDGSTPLALWVAQFCDDAPDRAAAYQAFFDDFPDLTAEPVDREAFLAEILPPIRTYVEAFALRIPPDQDPSPFAEEWREENITGISILAAYETWWEARAG
jgi:ankyrin repeat protein